MKIIRSATSYSDTIFSGLIRPSSVSPRRIGAFFKATDSKIAADLLLSVVLLLILAPVMFGIAVLVSLDHGPVFQRHRRIGKGGQHFYCLKFRSMVLNADKVLSERLARDPVARDEWERTQKLKRDPRLTWVGRFLRATGLDELPQLFNVLKLEMSLVGPRPIVENEFVRYGRNLDYYLEARPGVTGLWQVSGRGNTSDARRVALDAWYVKNWRFRLDVAIVFRTISVIVRRHGAP